MTKTIGWKTASGKNVEITMTHESIMADDISYADGYNLNLGRKPQENGTVVITIEGQKPVSVHLNAYTIARELSGASLKNNPQFAGMYQLPDTMILTSKENAALFNQTVAEVLTGGKNEEYMAHEAAEIAKAEKQEIAWANRIIAKAAKQDRLYTDAEIRIMTANYNDLYNEGGEGYVPTWVSQEQYDKAQSIIGK